MANESITVTQSLDQVTVVSEGPVGLNAGGTISGALSVLGDITVGVDGTGHDVKFFGDTVGKYMQWDQSADKLFVNGEIEVNGTATTFNSTVITIDDPIFSLGGQQRTDALDDSKDRGIEFFYHDGAQKTGFMGYDDSADAFTFLTSATNSNEVFSGTAATLLAGTVKASTIGTESGNLTLAPAGTYIHFTGKRLYGSNVGLGYHLNAVSAQYVALGTGIDSPTASLSRTANGTIALGNGTQNDATGTLLAGAVGIGTGSPAGKISSYVSATRQINLHDGSSGGDFSVVCDNNSTPVAHIKGTGTADLLNVFDNTTEVFTILDGGNVGIGVAAPDYKLDIGGTTANVVNTLRLTQNGGTAIRVGAGSASNDVTLLRVDTSTGGTDSAAHGFSLKYMGSRSGNANSLSVFSDNMIASAIEAVTIFQDGKVGIGTASPSALLHVSSATSHKPVVVVENTNADSSGTFLRMLKNTASPAVNDSIGSLQYQSNNDQGSGRVYAQIAARIHDPVAATATGELKFNTFVNGTDTTVMTMLDGHVGIGTSSPSGNAAKTTLHIDGTSQGAAIRMSQSGNSSLIRYDNTAGLQIGTIASKTLTLETGDTAAITIDTSQNVGIGTASPNALLHLSHATAPNLRLSRTGTGQVWEHSIDSSGRLLIREAASEGGTQYTRVAIDDDGNFGLGTGGPTSLLHVEGNTPIIQIRETSGAAEAGISINHSTGGEQYNWFVGTLDGSSRKLTIGATVTNGHSTDTAQAAASLMLIDQSTGNVGIGTTAPTREMHLHDADNALTTFKITNSTSGAAITDGFDIELSATDARLNNREGALTVGASNTDVATFSSSDIEFKKPVVLDEGVSNRTVKIDDDGVHISRAVDGAYTGGIFAGDSNGQQIDVKARSSVNLAVNNVQAARVFENKTIFYKDVELSGGSDIIIGGPDSAISNSAGHLYLRNDADAKDIILQSDDGSGGTATYFQVDGGSQILQVHKDLYALDNIRLRAGNSGDLQIFHNGADSAISNSTGHLYLRNTADDKDIIFQSDDGSGGTTAYMTIDGSREEVVANKPLIQTPGTVDPANNGELAFTVVSNTAIKIKYKGTDGVVRSTSLTLS